MPATFEPIATNTLGSAASTITFSSISSAYTDLRLVLVGNRSTAGTSDVYLRFNGDTGATYSQTMMYGDGTSALSGRNTSGTSIVLTYNTSGLTTGMRMYTADIFSYAGSTNKTLLAESNEDANGSGTVARRVGLWRDTSAINQVGLSLSSGNFAIGTTATLYGILKA